MRRLGWSECSPDALARLQSALDTAARAGFAVSAERLVAYGRAMGEVGCYDVEALAADPAARTPDGALRHVAVGTVVTDPVLVALRRLGQEHASEERFAARDQAPTARG